MTEPEWNTLPNSENSADALPDTDEDPYASSTTPGPKEADADSYATAPPSTDSSSTDPFQTAAGIPATTEPMTWPEEASDPNQQCLPGYEVLGILGQGGMGVVYKARHLRMKRLVAVKVIRSDRGITAEAIQRFNKEIEAAAQLTHPNVVMAFDADESDGMLYFVMEYVEGIDLAKLVRDHGPLPVEKACDYIRQAALGLQHAFERGLVHRDIKPSNLLLSKADGLVKILDLGLARLQEQVDQPASQLTGSGVVMGTPDFMSPEQGRDSRSVDIRSDLYSLGCTLYFLLAAQVPFPEGSFTEKLLKHCLDQPRPLTQLRPDLPPEVAAIVQKLLAKRPEDRYQTPGELAEALEPFTPPPVRISSSATRTTSLNFNDQRRPLPSTMSADNVAGKLAGSGGLIQTEFSMPGVGSEAARRPDSSADQTAAISAVRPRPAARHSLVLVLGLLAVLVGAGAGVALFVLKAEHGPETTPAVVAERPTSGSAVHTAPATTAHTVPKFPKIEPPPPPPPPPPPKPTLGVLARFDKPMQSGSLRTTLASNGEWALISEDGRVQLWRVPMIGTAEKPTASLNTVYSPVALALIPDGRRVFMARQADDPTTPIGKVPPVLWYVSLWTPSGAPQDRLLHGQKTALSCVALSTRGNYGLSGGIDKTVRLWDLETRTEKTPLGQHEAQVSCVAFSPDGRQALSGDWDGKTILWDLDSIKKPVIFSRHKNIVTCVAFSPDGRYALSAGYDKIICVYDAKSGEYLHSCTGHTEMIRSLAFLPDSSHFLSGSEDGSVRFWNTDAREYVKSYTDHNAGVLSVAASADGKYAVFICTDGTMRRLALPEKEP